MSKIFAMKMDDSEKKMMDLVSRRRGKTLASIFGPAVRQVLRKEAGILAFGILEKEIFSCDGPWKAGIREGQSLPVTAPRSGTDSPPQLQTQSPQSIAGFQIMVAHLTGGGNAELRKAFSGVILEHRDWMLFETNVEKVASEMGESVMREGLDLENPPLGELLGMALDLAVRHFFELVAVGNARSINAAWISAQPRLSAMKKRLVEEWVAAARKGQKESREKTPAAVASGEKVQSAVAGNEGDTDEIIDVDEVEYLTPDEMGRSPKRNP